MDKLKIYENAFEAIENVFEWAEGDNDRLTKTGFDTIVGICSMTDRMIREVDNDAIVPERSDNS